MAPTRARVFLVSLSVFTAGLALACVLVPLIDGPPIEVSMAAIVCVAVLQVFSHTIPSRLLALGGSVESITLDEVLFVPMLLILTPAELMATVFVASVAGSLVVRRAPEKAVFNCGQYLLAVASGLVVSRLIAGPSTSQVNLRNVVAAVVGTVVIAAVSRLAVTTMIVFATGAPWGMTIRVPSSHVMAWLGAAVLGACASTVAFSYSWGFVPALALVAFVQRAYSSQLLEASARVQAERLQRAIAMLRSTHERQAIEAALIGSTQELAGAREARLLDPGSPVPEGSLSVPMPSGSVLVAEGRIGPGNWVTEERAALLSLAGVADDALRGAELIAQLQTITDAQTESVVAFDADGAVTFANPAAVRMLRAASEPELLGRQINDVCSLRIEAEPVDLLEMLRSGTVVQDGDAALYTSRGNRIEVAYSFNPLTNLDDDGGGAVLVVRDVSERRAFQEALTYRALHDELTGLPNRRLFLDRLDDVLARSVQDGSHHSVVFVDLDRFKLVNDSFGHLVGDQLLVQMSDRLQRLVAPADTMARLSGDEFVILVENVDADRDVQGLSERMLIDLRQPYVIDGHTVLTTVSIGVAVTAPGDSRDDAMLAADAAAYDAKSAGRNCIRFATPELVDASRLRLEMEGRLRDALDKQHLTLRYQPIVDTKTRELAGLEALVRWEPPGGETVSPNDFIPLAEDTGLIVFLGRWVLEEACRVTHRWNTLHPERTPIVVSVNLSALQLAQPRLAQEVLEVLRRTSLPAEHLCLEITETAVLSDTESNVQTLRELRDIGVGVAVDDFGTGYSSLAYLRSLPVDVIKLDASFIAGLGQDMVDTQIVAAVLRLCKALGRRTVAEGVETELQWRTLTRMGCPFMQGYLIAVPMRETEFEDYWDSLHGPNLRAVKM